jgi:hypothetical protein
MFYFSVPGDQVPGVTVFLILKHGEFADEPLVE